MPGQSGSQIVAEPLPAGAEIGGPMRAKLIAVLQVTPSNVRPAAKSSPYGLPHAKTSLLCDVRQRGLGAFESCVKAPLPMAEKIPLVVRAATHTRLPPSVRVNPVTSPGTTRISRKL